MSNREKIGTVLCIATYQEFICGGYYDVFRDDDYSAFLVDKDGDPRHVLMHGFPHDICHSFKVVDLTQSPLDEALGITPDCSANEAAAMEITQRTHCDCGKFIGAERIAMGSNECTHCSAKRVIEEGKREQKEKQGLSLNTANQKVFAGLTANLIVR